MRKRLMVISISDGTKLSQGQPEGEGSSHSINGLQGGHDDHCARPRPSWCEESQEGDRRGLHGHRNSSGTRFGANTIYGMR